MTALNLGSSYSQIINPSDYNKIMSNEHLYIKISDRFILKKIEQMAFQMLEVVELGCGPGRVLFSVSQLKGINLTGLDVDQEFIEYSKKLVKGTPTQFVLNTAEDYRHLKPVDIFYSQGFHHHISKGKKTTKYLKNIYNQLKVGGLYIISDEFVPDYASESEREIRLVIWYSHVIAHALRHNYNYLAQEEAKTLLDDLYEGRTGKYIKSPAQIQFVLSRVSEIDEKARTEELQSAEKLAENFLKELTNCYNIIPYDDNTIDLSRGDYKICDRVLRDEVTEVGFIVEEVRSFGPIKTIGGMSVYLLKKGK